MKSELWPSYLMHKIDIFRYFFLVFTGLIVLGIFNGLIFLPVLLVLVGPPAEVIPNDGAEAIDPPTPHVEKKSTTRSNPLHKSPPNIKINATNLQHHKRHHHYNQSDLSLSTIAEESGSYASNTQADAYPMTSQSFNGASVFVEPHVVVETTTYPHVSSFPAQLALFTLFSVPRFVIRFGFIELNSSKK